MKPTHKWTEKMLALVRSGVQSRKPMSHVLEEVRKIDPTIKYGVVALKYRQLMAANLSPNWSQSTSAARGKRHHWAKAKMTQRER